MSETAKQPIAGFDVGGSEGPLARLSVAFNRFAELMAVATILVGASVLIGWAFDSPALKSLRPNLVVMTPNAAVGLVLLGASLWMLRREPVPTADRRQARAACLVTVVVGVLTLSEYLIGRDLGIDRLLFREPAGVIWTSHPGRMAPPSAIVLVLLGYALRRLDGAEGHRRVEAAVFTALFIALVAFLAQVYALELLHGTGYYTHMAVHEAAAFCFLCAGILAARPERGLMAFISSEQVGGRVARRLLPAAIAAPVLLAWIGFAGQHLGYYHGGFALAVVTLGDVAVFAAVVLRSARFLNELDVERERAAASLQHNQERFRLLVDAARDYAIFLLDADGCVQSWNPGAERIKGYAEAEILGRHFSIFYPREDAARGEPARDLAAAARHGRFESEGWRVRKDGSRFWANVIINPLVDEEGRVRGYAPITRDVSERRRIEEELRRTNADLASRERALQEALADLSRTHDELKKAQIPVLQSEKMESIGRLAAGVAHEVKNPLAIVQSGIDYFSARETAGTDAEVLGEMQKAVIRATTILGGLIDHSAPRTLQLEKVELNDLIGQALELVKHDLGRNRIQVVRSLAESLPPTTLDRLKIEQVLVNVFLNAVHAMPRGGTLSIKTYSALGLLDMLRTGSRTSAVTQRSGQMQVVEISDTGPGIPPEHLRRIFEPFFTTKPTGKGTGLGLTLTKAIVDMHGGSVRVANRKEGGARVTIALPMKGVPDGAQAAASAG